MSRKNNKWICERSLMSFEWFLETKSLSLEVKLAASQSTANGLKYLGQSRPQGSETRLEQWLEKQTNTPKRKKNQCYQSNKQRKNLKPRLYNNKSWEISQQNIIMIQPFQSTWPPSRCRSSRRPRRSPRWSPALSSDHRARPPGFKFKISKYKIQFTLVQFLG